MGLTEKEKYLADIVVRVYGVSVEEIVGESKERYVVTARWTLMYFMREILGYSYPRIGTVMDKHHTTAMNSLKSFDLEELNRVLGVLGTSVDAIRKSFLEKFRIEL